MDEGIEKTKGKRAAFIDEPPCYPPELAEIRNEWSQDRHVLRRNKEIKFLMDVFDTIEDLKSILKEHRLWDYLWDKLLKPINEASEKATRTAVKKIDDPRSKELYAEIDVVRELCAATSHRSLNDPYNGDGVLTNLVHIITLAETVRHANLAWRDKAEWDGVIFASFRRIWARFDRLLPGPKKPQTIGYIQDLNPLGIGRSKDIGVPGCLASPPVFAVSVSGTEDNRELLRRLRTTPFTTFGIETQSIVKDNVHWAGGTCTEAQNWLALIPTLMHGGRPKFLISSTFMINDIWRKREASDLFQSVKPFCGNCCALAESLATHGLYVTDGAQNPSSEDLRLWYRSKEQFPPINE